MSHSGFEQPSGQKSRASMRPSDCSAILKMTSPAVRAPSRSASKRPEVKAGCRASPATTSAFSSEKRRRSPSCPSFTPESTATESTTWMPASRHRSMAASFTSRMSRPHVASYTSPVIPSKDRYTPVSPASTSVPK